MSRILLRQGLLTQLHRALDRGHVVLEAPAGYGKTLLLQQLAGHRPNSYLLPLTPADTDPALLQARLQRRVDVSSAGAGEARRQTLLLDDVHRLAGAEASCNLLEEQLGRLYPRLVLAGRFMPLPRELIDQAHRFSPQDLAFTADESSTLLSAAGSSPATADELLPEWHSMLEGWPLGLGLVTQLRADRRNAASLKDAARPRLFSYLARNVYTDLPPELQRFLRMTAVPLHFNDELAVALTQREDAARKRQLLQERNLFLYEEEEAGWYRYHELIREFLLQLDAPDASSARQQLFRQTVGWFAAREDLEMAVEHALVAGRRYNDPEFWRLAAAKMIEAQNAILTRQGRIWTYQRWVQQLPPDPISSLEIPGSQLQQLLQPFIRKLHEAGMRGEAWRYFEQLLQLISQEGDRRQLAETYWLKGFLYFNEAQHEESLKTLEAVAKHTDGELDLERRYNELLAHNLAGLNRLQEAGQAYRRAIAQAEALGDEAAAMYSRHNLASLVLIRQGKLAESRQVLLNADDFFERSGPYLLAGHLLSWAEIYQETGDWNGLQAVLRRQETLLSQLEEWIDDDRLYVLWSRAFLYTGQSRLRQAQEILDEAMALPVEDDMAQLCLASVQAWLYRRQGQEERAVAYVDEMLVRHTKWPYWRAMLALEGEIAGTMADGASQTGDVNGRSELELLIQVRAAPHLVRLRALLAIRCWRQGRARWRRHFSAALYGLRRPQFHQLLTGRDPELGVQFWRLALLEDVAVEEAGAALISIGQAEPLLDLLHPTGSGDVSGRVAPILAAIGDERAMPALQQSIRRTKKPATKRRLTKALQQLENLPPPALDIRLMGNFQVTRGGEPVPSAAFHRPVVMRLLQYFAVHRRRILPRDRILEDIWPDKPHDKAWSTFRSVHSRLRKVLEPYMRSNGPVRYFNVEGESYQFDPLDVVTVDSERFEALVQGTLRDAAEASISPLPAALPEALEAWKPILPDAPYADWLTETRERLHETYVEGCLYVAQALLQRDEPAAATRWAQRVIEEAPWFEAAYQTLMQAYARQGQRTLALKVYNDAEQALAAEFAVAPSPLTEWLRRRLEAGETI